MNEVFIIIGLILLNGVFAMSEVALISARKSRLSADAKNGNKSAKTALKLANEPDRFLSTVQIGITLIDLLGIKEEDNKVTEEEIKSIIKEGSEDGEVQPVEQDIMQRVFLLGDLKVGSIMTHKSDIVWLDTDMTVDDADDEPDIIKRVNNDGWLV